MTGFSWTSFVAQFQHICALALNAGAVGLKQRAFARLSGSNHGRLGKRRALAIAAEFGWKLRCLWKWRVSEGY